MQILPVPLFTFMQLRMKQCSNEAASGAKNQEQEQAGSGAEASAGSQKLLLSLLLGASVKTGLLFNQDLLFMQQLLSKIYVTTEEPVVKGASVTTEATAIPGAPATTEVQNNSAEVQNNSASASDPVDAEAPAKILIPLEHCCTSNGWMDGCTKLSSLSITAMLGGVCN